MITSTSPRRGHAMLAFAVAAPMALMPAGCASRPPPPQADMAVANAAVLRAATTDTSADAPVQLQVATAKLASARQAMAAKEFDRAKQLAEQAELDAQLAELHARSERSRRAALESQDAARVLRDEINRNTAR